jgi:hypothetical protein
MSFGIQSSKPSKRRSRSPRSNRRSRSPRSNRRSRSRSPRSSSLKKEEALRQKLLRQKLLKQNKNKQTVKQTVIVTVNISVTPVVSSVQDVKSNQIQSEQKTLQESVAIVDFENFLYSNKVYSDRCVVLKELSGTFTYVILIAKRQLHDLANEYYNDLYNTIKTSNNMIYIQVDMNAHDVNKLSHGVKSTDDSLMVYLTEHYSKSYKTVLYTQDQLRENVDEWKQGKSTLLRIYDNSNSLKLPFVLERSKTDSIITSRFFPKNHAKNAPILVNTARTHAHDFNCICTNTNCTCKDYTKNYECNCK